MAEKYRSRCAAPGYFNELHTQPKTIESHESKSSCRYYANTKTLPVDFNWSNMPMLSIVTGVNGVGKTALLQSIFLTHPYSGEKISMDRDVFVNMKYNEHSVDDTMLIEILLDAMVNEIEETDEISISQFQIESIQAKVNKQVDKNLAKRTQIFYYSTVPDENSYFEMLGCSQENHWNSVNPLDNELVLYASNRGSIQQEPNIQYEHIINYFINCVKKQPNDGQTEINYNELGYFYVHYCLFHPEQCTHSVDALLYLLATTTTKDKLNEFLKEKNSNYTVHEVNYGAKINRVDVLVEHRFDKRIINLGLLSPGEEFHFLHLLLQYEFEVFSSTQTYLPAILLLDEPDAHLHPSYIKDFIEYIVKLVVLRKMQIIVTTHKPTTIRYVPFDECLFIMNRDVQTDCVNIEHAFNKNQAVQLLTSNVLQINENFRLVFVEANRDKIFYTNVQKHLNVNKWLCNIDPLLFECYGNLSTPIIFNEQLGKRVSVIVDDANRDQVINLVRKLVENGDEDDLSLKNFIYGLVDGDNLVDNKLLEKYNILTLNRHSIENYIFDPIHVFFYLVGKLNDIPEQKRNETLKTIQDIQTQLNIVFSNTMISDILKQENAQFTLQKIINDISELFTNALNDILKNPNKEEYKNVVANLRATRNDTNSNLTTNNKYQKRKDEALLDKHDNLIDNRMFDVKIINNINSPVVLQYPVLLLKIQGHSAATVYDKLHDSLSMDKMLQFVEKQMIIPEDLFEIFTRVSDIGLTETNSPPVNTLQTPIVKNFFGGTLNHKATNTRTTKTTLSYNTSSQQNIVASNTSCLNTQLAHTPHSKDACISDGYLKFVHIEEKSEDTRHLPSQFEWSNIPMLSIIVGVNGIGKTALLNSIFYKHPTLSEFDIAKNVRLELNQIGDIFLHSEALGSIPKRCEDFSRCELPKPDCSTMIASFSHFILRKKPYSRKLFIESSETHRLLDFIHNPIAIFTNVKYFIKFIYGLHGSNIDELNTYLSKKQFKYCILTKEHSSHFFSLSNNNTKETIPNVDDIILQLQYITNCSAEKFQNPTDYLEHLVETERITLNEVNTYLQTFNYCFTKNPYTKLKITFVNQANSFDTLHDCLSPGERFILLNLLLEFPPCTQHLPNKVSGSILLLDEPDAHLHPSLIKDFMQYMHTLVNKYEIQVIMTTHSPETVALLSKENKRSLFIMDLEANTDRVYIKQAANKYQAIRLLTSDVIQINDSFRLVFVESVEDKFFYEYVNTYLIKKRRLNNVQQLIFRYHSPCEKKTIKLGIHNNVQRLVQKFISACGDNKPLENFVYGLVNQDYIEYIEGKKRQQYCPQEYKQIKNVIAVNRCSSVNYIFDPIHVYYYASINRKLNSNNRFELKCLLNLNCSHDYDTLQEIIDILFPPLTFQSRENIYFSTTFYLKYPLEVLDWNEANFIKHYNDSACFSNLNLQRKDMFNFLKSNDILVPLDLFQAFDYLNSEEPHTLGYHEVLVTKKRKATSSC